VTCPNCARPAEADDRFCAGCGAALQVGCVACGRSAPAGSAYCAGCGQPLGGPAARLPQEDRRRVSVLFVDMVEFTGFGERSDPEQVRALQHEYFTVVRRVVRRYGGVVEKFIGDAVMALFGAPVATENDPLRCIRAGIEVQAVLARGDGETSGLRFRVGVATGEALVNVAAARDGGQAILAGDVVNTAARLQALAPPGGVLVCATSYAATSADIEYQEHPPVTLRGHSHASTVWLALAARDTRTPATDTENTPMVGREHERSLLVNALYRTVRSSTPQLVTVFGEAGIGKSRLLRELSRHAARQRDPSVHWLVGHCPPFGEGITYAAFADMVKTQAGIVATDDPATAAGRLSSALHDLVPPDEAATLAESLRPLVVPGDEAHPAPGEAEPAWRRFVLALASRRPTVLVFEDLHWADERLLHFIELLATSARGLPLLLVCTGRPQLRDRHPRFATTIGGTLSLALSPLRDSDISSMYALMFGSAFAATTPYPLVELADGNPLYAQEYVRMLLEHGQLVPEVAGWSSASDAPPPMPDNVQAVIANRLDLLEPDDRAVLQAAAVLGRHFWPAAVAAALGRPVEAVDRALRRLEQRDLIREQPASTLPGDTEYRFRHVLVRDVCYHRLPRAERLARHHRAADWLADALDRPAGAGWPVAQALAQHRYTAYLLAQQMRGDLAGYARAAASDMQRAAARGYARQDLPEARRWLTRIRELDLPVEPRVELLEMELDILDGRDAFLAGDGLARLAKLAESTGDAQVRAVAARASHLLGTASADRREILHHLDRAVELYDSLPDSEEKARALLDLARAHLAGAEYEPAALAAGAAADLADRLVLADLQGEAIAAQAKAVRGAER
jgi:class 3 adenylate cyclase